MCFVEDVPGGTTHSIFSILKESSSLIWLGVRFQSPREIQGMPKASLHSCSCLRLVEFVSA